MDTRSFHERTFRPLTQVLTQSYRYSHVDPWLEVTDNPISSIGNDDKKCPTHLLDARDKTVASHKTFDLETRIIMARLVIPSLTIAIVTEHYLVWLGLQKLFESRAPQIEVLPQQTMVSDALLIERPPDLLILDTETIRDPTSSIQLIRKSASSGKIMLLSGLEDKECLCEAIKCGVESVILKIQPPEVVLAAITALYCPANYHTALESNQVLDGEPLTKTERKTSALAWPEELTEREREIVALVGQGLSNKDIAYQLSISDSTVRHHLTSIFGKVGVTSRQKLLVHTHHVSKPHSNKRI